MPNPRCKPGESLNAQPTERPIDRRILSPHDYKTTRFITVAPPTVLLFCPTLTCAHLHASNIKHLCARKYSQGYTQLTGSCGTGPILKDTKDGQDLTFETKTFRECYRACLMICAGSIRGGCCLLRQLCMLSAGECAERNKVELEYGCKGFNFEFAKTDALALMWRGPGIDEHAHPHPHATLFCFIVVVVVVVVVVFLFFVFFFFWRGVCGLFPAHALTTRSQAVPL